MPLAWAEFPLTLASPMMKRFAPVAAAVLTAAVGCSSGSPRPSAAVSPPPAHPSATVTTGAPVAPPSPPGIGAVASSPSSRGRLRLVQTIRGDITPKSVVASGRGLAFAQNMMYTHTITVYDRRGRLVRTIRDDVALADFGFSQYAGRYRGAPVEAAFTPDGRSAYVSNYSMYGPDLSHQGDDVCSPQLGIDNSFLYRIDTASLRIAQVISVGAVPKFVAVTPNGRLVLATNWCSWSLTVIDASTGRSIREVPLGRYPRGIAVDPMSRTAYVAVMGASRVARVDLRTFRVSWLPAVGSGPRHLVTDAAGRWLYVTLNGDGRVAKVDLRTGRMVAKVRTGSQPRSMAISADGLALYVVNYASDTISKLRTSDMSVVQTVPVNHHPIGISYDTGTGDVWVACYSGSLMVFRDS